MQPDGDGLVWTGGDGRSVAMWCMGEGIWWMINWIETALLSGDLYGEDGTVQMEKVGMVLLWWDLEMKMGADWWWSSLGWIGDGEEWRWKYPSIYVDGCEAAVW